jgi:hypothetical protein
MSLLVGVANSMVIVARPARRPDPGSALSRDRHLSATAGFDPDFGVNA